MEDDISPDNTMDTGRLWKSQIKAWEKTPGQSCRKSGSEKKATQGYAEKNSARHAERIQAMLNQIHIKPHYRILDIGAGAGTLAVPMAQMAHQVTAVDPSMTMNSVLKDYMTSQGITNIFCVHKAWEDPDILDHLEPPYHLVVASLSLGMPDIKAAIRKMEAVACGDIILYWHAGTPGWEKMPRALWPTLFKTRYHGGPKSDLLFLVLYEMGIYPRVDLLECQFKEQFPSIDAAVNSYAEKFRVTDSALFPLIEAYLKKVMIHKNNEWVYPIDHVVMKFQWQAGRRYV